MNEYDFIVKKKLLSLLDKKFRILDSNDNLIGMCVQKGLKLVEDIRVYTDEDQRRESISIRADRVIDFSAVYNVADSETGAFLGSWKRQGLQSIVRDSWVLYDANDNVIGKLEEDSPTLALVRRFLCNLIPQTYYLKNSYGVTVATYEQTFNPFIYGLKVKMSKNKNVPHKKLLMAGAMLLATIEGRQQ